MTEETKLPKVVSVNCYNRMGSTGKIIEDINAACKGSYSFGRIYEYEQTSDDRPDSYRVTNTIQRVFYYFLNRWAGYKYCTGLFPTNKAIRLIKKISPAIVHLHCPNMGTIHITRLMHFLKKRDIPTVITNHAEFYYTGNCPYAFDCKKYMTGCGNCDYVFDSNRNYRFDRTAYEWMLMKKAFEGWKKVVVVSVSPWQMERSAASPIMEGIEQRLILNGVDDGVFFHREDAAFSPIREKGYQKVIMHVTASFSDNPNDLKNGRAVIEMAKRLPQYAFVVVGPNRVTQELPPNVIPYGWISDQEQLAKLYSDADLTLITSRKETFGMSCAESLCCGTPLVGFNAGGPETISMKEYSEFVAYNDLDALEQTIKNWMNKDVDKQSICTDAAVVYKKERMGMAYRELYDAMLK